MAEMLHYASVFYASVVNAPALGAGDREFKSLYPDTRGNTNYLSIKPYLWIGLFVSYLIIFIHYLSKGGHNYGGHTSSLSWTVWIYILYEVFAGEAAQASAASNSAGMKSAFNALKWIVSIGWSIYPIGYFLGYLSGAGADAATLNWVYNLADYINKIAFGVIIWAAAKADTSKA